ncbi:MAG: hypothetical protein FJ297_10120 [Planctomycetes bacterium]|nr:hypothetical protein [Planctomycetota bacterium]
MKRTTLAMATVVLGLLASPREGAGQDANMWRPAVAPAPINSPAPPPGEPVWQPAVYPSPFQPGMMVSPQAQMAAYGTNGASCASQGCASADCASRGGTGQDCGCERDWCREFLADRFGVCGTWGSVEFLHVWAEGRTLPPLITTSPDATPRSSACVLPGATILFGGDRVGDDRQSAGRLTTGVWLDECQTTGVGVRLFAIEGSNAGMLCYSDATGSPICGVPFNNVLTGLPDALLGSYPGEQAGQVRVTTSQDVMTGELFLRALVLRGDGLRVDLLGGYHYAQVSDGVNINTNTTMIDPGGLFPVGTTVDVIDRFDARNDFHGASAGLQGELRHGCWRWHSLTKISFGNMREVLTVSGQTTTFIAGGASTIDANGLFAQTSNIGTFVRDETTFIPELGLGMGYQITDMLELTVGYSAIYWANILAAGDQIDTYVDLSQAGGGPVAARPAINLRDTEFWVQGISLGLNWNY